MRYVTLSLIFLALYPTRLAAQDIDQRTLEGPGALAKRCLSYGPDYIDNHCSFAVNVLVLRIPILNSFRVTIRADSEVKIRSPLQSGERIYLTACTHPKKEVVTESHEITRPNG